MDGVSRGLTSGQLFPCSARGNLGVAFYPSCVLEEGLGRVGGPGGIFHSVKGDPPLPCGLGLLPQSGPSSETYP